MRQNSSGGRIRLRRFGQEVAGFVLLEIMFTFAVFVTTLSLLAGSFMGFMEVGEIADSRQFAVARVASVLEELRHTPYENLPAFETSQAGTAGAQVSTSVACFDESGNPISLPAAPSALEAPLPDPLRVQVTVTVTTRHDRRVSAAGTALVSRDKT